MKYWRVFFSLTLIILIGSLAWAWNYIHEPGVIPIKKVTVVGARVLVQSARIETAVLPYLADGFFNVNVAGGQKALATIPGIKSATIRRVWPNQITISIQEYTALAKWQNDAWLSPEGEIFYTDTPPVTDQALPQFSAFKEDIPLLLTMYPKLSEELKPYDLHIMGMFRLGYNAWRLSTDKGFDLKLKLDDLKPLSSFLGIYQQLLEENPHKILGHVDLRYPTGFSVKWRGS